MNYSRRHLYALGEPFGESATRLKPGGRVYGGGGPSTPEKTTQVTDLPDWAKGYAQDTLAKTSALTDISKNPYQQYRGERIAGFQPMQQQAFESAATMRPSEQLGLGTGLAGAAGLGALGTNYQGRNFQGGQFTPQAAEDYMSPYTQNVVDYQKSQALRDFQIAQPMRQAQAVQQGAFGGSRSAIVDAEAQRALNSQLQGITATGQQQAFQNAQQQFNADQARRLEAQRMGEQSRQYGAGLSMQGLQTALQSAGQLGQLGQTEYGQRMGITGLQSQFGQQQQQQAQRPLDMAYQDFINQQNYPYKQLGFMSDMIRGLPLGQQSTSQVYQGSGNTMGQLAGLGMGAYGLSKMMAEGGMVYADGGSVTDVNNVDDILNKLSDQQLQQAKEAALNRRDAEQAQMIDAEIARRNAVRQPSLESFGGIAPALPEQFADGMEQSMATGGIVAFAGGDAVSEDKTSRFSQSGLGRFLNAISPPDAQQQEAERLRKYNEFISASQAQPGFFENVSPEKLKQSEKQVEEAARQLTTNKEALKKEADERDLRANRPPVKGAGARTAPSVEEEVPKAAPAAEKKTAKPRYEDISAAPKPSKKEVKSAVTQFAEQNNLGASQKEDLMTTALKIREEFGKQNQPILDKLNEAIEGQKPDEKAIRERGFNQALTEFGFGLAERASKPGARFLESVSGAAPAISKVAAKTDELLQSRKDNYTKLKLDQAKYEVALAKGDMQTAAVLAGQIRQANQQDKTLQFQIAKAQDDMRMEEAKLASQNAYQRGVLAKQPETLQGLVMALEKATPEQRKLYEQAANLRYGTAAGIGAIEKNKSAFIDGMKIIDANYPPMIVNSNPKMAAMREQAIRELKALTNMDAAGASTGATAPNSGQWGEMRVKP